MSQLNIFLIFAYSLVLTACGFSSNSYQDLKGNCTHDFVTDFNQILAQTQNSKMRINDYVIKDLEETKAYEQAEVVCDRFFRNHKGTSCKAIVNGKNKRIDSEMVSNQCLKVKNSLNTYNQASLKGEFNPISVKLINSEKLLFLLESTEVFVQRGIVGAFHEHSESYLNGVAVCSANSPSIKNHEALSQLVFKKIVVQDVTSGNQRLFYLSHFFGQNEYLNLICVKSGNKKFSLGEIQEAFKGILDFGIKEDLEQMK